MKMSKVELEAWKATTLGKAKFLSLHTAPGGRTYLSIHKNRKILSSHAKFFHNDFNQIVSKNGFNQLQFLQWYYCKREVATTKKQKKEQDKHVARVGWERLSNHVLRERRAAVVLLQNWQEKACAPGNAGRERDRAAFVADTA